MKNVFIQNLVNNTFMLYIAVNNTIKGDKDILFSVRKRHKNNLFLLFLCIVYSRFPLLLFVIRVILYSM